MILDTLTHDFASIILSGSYEARNVFNDDLVTSHTEKIELTSSGNSIRPSFSKLYAMLVLSRYVNMIAIRG